MTQFLRNYLSMKQPSATKEENEEWRDVLHHARPCHSSLCARACPRTRTRACMLTRVIAGCNGLRQN